MLELVLVSAIVAILAAIAVPRYGNASTRHRLDLAARRVAADLRLAQSQAKTSSSSCTVVFGTATNHYELKNLPAPDGVSGNYRVILSREPYKVNLLSASFDGSAQLSFNGWGLPSSGGQVIVARGSSQKKVIVDGETGQISIE
jgi:type II secretory pathway pseudopilin PulG